MKIYIAAPMFCEAEKCFNEHIDEVICSYGHKTYLPQRDGGCFADMPDFINGKSKAEVIHKWDIDAREWCDVLIFVFDGRVPDEGACFELGYAYAKKKKCIGYKTDVRSLINGYDNLMIWVSLDQILRNEEELVHFLRQ